MTRQPSPVPALMPDAAQHLARVRADLSIGVPLVMTDPDGDVVILAAEAATDARLDALRTLGPVALAITARRAATLKARAYDGDLARIAVPDSAGLAWVQAVADPADDLRAPMKGPLVSLRDGTAAGARAAVVLAKAARLLPAALVVPVPDGAGIAAAHGLGVIAASRVQAQTSQPLVPVVSARVPLAVSKAGRVHVFRTGDGSEEHYAVEIGLPDRDSAVLTRLHSACFTGDLLDSLKCDCGPQLRAALAQMGAEGAGVLLYLNQEGRGIGLANKMRAYSLQDQGFDTVEANHRLGFEDDERDFRLGADILRRLGFSKVRLMTNNPAKVARLEGCGLAVTERVPLRVGETAQNRAYLAVKAAKSGHLL